MTSGGEPDSVHPGYFLPTAAGGLIGANAAAQVHLHALAQASFGIGVLSWAVLGSVILNRLFAGPAASSRSTGHTRHSSPPDSQIPVATRNLNLDLARSLAT
jgi:tellurite resistance protein